MDDPLLRLEIRNLDAKALLWRAVADELASTLKQMIPGTHYRAVLRKEALACYEAALIDGRITERTDG